MNQSYLPEGLIVDDDDGAVYIADWWNNRVMAWKQNEIEGRIVVGARGKRRDSCTPLYSAVLPGYVDVRRPNF